MDSRLHVLVTFDKDYADEFNVISQSVFTVKEWERFKLDFLAQGTFFYNFGTNEGWGEDDTVSAKEVLDNDLKVQEISLIEYNILKERLPKYPMVNIMDFVNEWQD